MTDELHVQDIIDLVLASIREQSRNSLEPRLETNMRDLGFDSLDYNDLATAIEKRFGWRVDDDKLWQYSTAREIVEAIRTEELRAPGVPNV